MLKTDDINQISIILENKKEVIIESFSKYFGYEYKDLITKKINNVSLNFYIDFDTLIKYKQNRDKFLAYNISKKILDKLDLDTTYYVLKGDTDLYGYISDEYVRLKLYNLFNEDFLISNNNNFLNNSYDCLSFLQLFFDDIDVYGSIEKQLKNPEIKSCYENISKLLNEGINEYNQNKTYNEIDFEKTNGIYKFNYIFNNPNIDLSLYYNNREEVCITSKGIANILFNILELNDILLIHELLHALSLHEDIKNDSVNYSTGFNTLVKGKIFNEVITQLIARDISKDLNKNNLSITSDITSSGYLKVEYERYFPLVEKFFNKYKDIIKISYLTDNNLIIEEVGYDNITSLAELITKAYITKDITNNIEESNEIFDNMLNYNVKAK